MPDIISKIRTEREALHSEEVALNNKLRYLYHSGMKTYDLLQDVERIQKRRVELEIALKILEEFE